MSTTTKKAAPRTATTANSVTSNQSQTLEQMWRLSAPEKEEQQLQYNLQDSLNSLQETIKETGRSLDTAKRSYNSLLTTPSRDIDWESVAKKEKEIEGYEAGVKRLKAMKNRFYPSWKDTISAD